MNNTNTPSIDRNRRAIGMMILGAMLCLSTTYAQEKISIDADFSRLTAKRTRTIGIGVNFLSDSPEIGGRLRDLHVGCIRYATTEYTRFQPDSPETFGVAIRDQSLWPVQKFTDTKKWYSKLSFDQFMTLCRNANAEPCVVLPIDAMIYTGKADADSADDVVQAATDWVRYANVTKKYNVRHWEIGNESDIVTNPNVKWTPESYAEATIRLSKAMKSVDPTIKVGVNGMRMGQTLPWWDELLPKVAGHIDFLVTHQYSWLPSYENWRTDPSRYDYNVTDAATALKKHKLQVPILVTEVSGFNPAAKQPNCAWKALHSFEVIGNVLSHSEVESAIFWTSKWLGKNDASEDVNALTDDNQISAMGQTLAIWCQHGQGDVAQCPDRSGVRAWFCRKKDGTMSLFVLNKGSHAVAVTLNISGTEGRFSVNNAAKYTSTSPSAVRLSNSPLKVTEESADQLKLGLPPLTLGIVNGKVR